MLNRKHNPGCPCCGDCTKCSGAPEEWVADFGIGGWTNSQFPACTNYSGEITLTTQDISGQGGPLCLYGGLACQVSNVCCLWNGPIDGNCVPVPPEDCQGGSGLFCAITGRSPTLALSSTGPSSWKFTLWVWLVCDFGEAGFSKAVYSSTPSSSDNCLVDADEDGKITLSKDSDAHSGPCQPCIGSLPATVDIWPAT
jgi:hypothetical protein